ncbi:MAG: hypothetical protein HYZ73_04750 [Elusimicrobia bacterium]|nr:hypothetical protein [Elusimicrobiota bacterium]
MDQTFLSPDQTKRRIRLEPSTGEVELPLDPPRIVTVLGTTKGREVKRYHLKITGSKKLTLL